MKRLLALCGCHDFESELERCFAAGICVDPDAGSDAGFDAGSGGPVLLLGDDHIETSTDTHTTATADASQFTAGRSGVVHSLTVWYAAGDAETFELGLYDDQGGHPHALLTHATISGPTPGNWITATVPAAAVTAGTVYWIALVATSPPITPTFGFNYSVVTGMLTEHSAQNDLDALPSTWTAGQDFPDTVCSFYASQ
jgi:hypothetical protein